MSNKIQINIRAEGQKDLDVISSLMQDATVRVGDLAYDRNSHQFACLANRFRWENKEVEREERIRSILRFEHVLKTVYKNIPLKKTNHTLNLLSLDCVEGEDFEKTIIFVFSGFASIKIKVECIEVFLKDLTKPWKTNNKPEHSITQDLEKN